MKPNMNPNPRVTPIFGHVGQVTLDTQDIPDSLVADGQITLPVGVDGIRLASVLAEFRGFRGGISKRSL